MMHRVSVHMFETIMLGGITKMTNMRLSFPAVCTFKK